MPAIASLDHFKAAQKEGLSFCAVPYLSSKAETTVPEDALCRIWALASRTDPGTVKRGERGVTWGTDSGGKSERSNERLRGQCTESINIPTDFFLYYGRKDESYFQFLIDCERAGNADRKGELIEFKGASPKEILASKN